MKPIEAQEKAYYEVRAKIFKALAHPTRLWITRELAHSERCVCEFVDAVGADFSTVSKHLSVLKQAGIISSEKRGKWVYYQLQTPCVFRFMECVDDILAQQAERQHSALGQPIPHTGRRNR